MKENSDQKVSRREYIALSGTAVVASTFGIGQVTADEMDISSKPRVYEQDNGILIVNENGLSQEDVMEARSRTVKKFVKKDAASIIESDEENNIILTNTETEFDTKSKETNLDLVAYYIGWEDGAPLERKFKIPSFASTQLRKARVKNAVSEVENKAYVMSDGDVIDADDGWGAPVGRAFDDTYVYLQLDDKTVTAGHLNLRSKLWEADRINGKRQFGCALGTILVPGTELEEDTEVPNPGGLNNSATINQKYDGPDPGIVNYGPVGDHSGGFFNRTVDLESITFGADSSGPFGSVTINPTDSNVDSINDNMQPGDRVETNYSFGGWIDQKRGGDSRHKLGNSGVFLWERIGGLTDICRCEIETEFQVNYYDSNGDVHTQYVDGMLQESYQARDLGRIQKN